MLDYDRINNAALANLESLCRDWLPQGRRYGREYVCGDLSGVKGKSLSINLTTGVWKDFACDISGCGAVSLLAAIRSTSAFNAALELDSSLRTGATRRSYYRSTKKAPVNEDWQPCPEGKILPPPEATKHPKFGLPAHVYNYPGYGVVCRFECNGKKEVIPLAWCKHPITFERSWRWKSFSKPRPLYVPKEPLDGQVFLIVEGEKAALAASRMLPTYNVVSWPGGSSAVHLANFSQLKMKSVVIWPDNDEPGVKAAKAIQSVLPHAKIVTPPEGKPSGWDLADAEEEWWTERDALPYLKKA